MAKCEIEVEVEKLMKLVEKPNCVDEVTECPIHELLSSSESLAGPAGDSDGASSLKKIESDIGKALYESLNLTDEKVILSLSENFCSSCTNLNSEQETNFIVNEILTDLLTQTLFDASSVATRKSLQVATTSVGEDDETIRRSFGLYNLHADASSSAWRLKSTESSTTGDYMNEVELKEESLEPPPHEGLKSGTLRRFLTIKRRPKTPLDTTASTCSKSSSRSTWSTLSDCFGLFRRRK